MQTTTLEHVSKAATCASVALLVLMLLGLQPDLTWGLLAASVAAFVVGLAAGRVDGGPVQCACIFALPVAPALLRIIAGREGPVLDIIWLSGLAGALLRSVPWSQWTLPATWRPLIGGWALALALGWPIIVAREVGFSFAGFFDTGAVVSWAEWWTAPWSSPRAATWILYWTLTSLLGLLWFEWIWRRFQDRDALPLAGHALWIGATVASVVAVLQGVVDLTFLSTPFWARMGRAAGTLLDANSYGHIAALAGPIAFLAARSIWPRRLSIAWLLLTVNWVGMWMSGSRTALLCAMLGGVGLLAVVRRAGDTIGEEAVRLRARVTVAVLLLAAAALVLVVAGATGPVRRLTELATDGPVTTLWERGGYGSIAMRIIREHPLVGTGAGTFHFLAPDYFRVEEDDALAPDNAQNWWRHQSAELGVLGGAAILFWSAIVGWRVIAGRARTDAASGAAPIVRALLLGFAGSSLLGVPTQSPIVLLWFFLLVAWLDVLVPVPLPSPAGARRLQVAWVAVLLLAIGYAGGQLLLARSSLSIEERARRFERPYVVGAQPPEPFEGTTQFRWTGAQAHFALPAPTPWLILRLWALHPDIVSNPVHVTVSTACGVLWEETLSTRSPVSAGVVLPAGASRVDLTVTVSRTWRPSDYGEEDTRRLGVGVVTDFVGSEGQASAEAQTAVWPCRGV